MANLQDLFDAEVTQVKRGNHSGYVHSEHSKQQIGAKHKGKTLSDEHMAILKAQVRSVEFRKKVSEGCKGRVPPNLQAVMTPYGEFVSVKQAAIGVGCSPATLFKYFKTKPQEYFRINKEV